MKRLPGGRPDHTSASRIMRAILSPCQDDAEALVPLSGGATPMSWTDEIEFAARDRQAKREREELEYERDQAQRSREAAEANLRRKERSHAQSMADAQEATGQYADDLREANRELRLRDTFLAERSLTEAFELWAEDHDNIEED